jgi:hypothetical protein
MEMNKQVLSGMGLGALLLFILIGAGVYVSSQPGEVPDNGSEYSISEKAVQEFTDKMREGTIARVGQPIEGFEPFMFMQAFPGLMAQDFDGVDALIGLYRYQDGEVVYDLNGEVETHSAARAISDEGMRQLLSNIIANRTIFSDLLDTPDFVTPMLNSLASTPDLLPSNPAAGGGIEPTLFGTRVTFAGEIVCLPHKGNPEVTTMECAFGLKADNGSYYGITNMYSGSHIADIGVGEHVEITGILREPRTNEIYDIVGVIDVENRWPISPNL